MRKIGEAGHSYSCNVPKDSAVKIAVQPMGLGPPSRLGSPR
jgi:hypothetical protein